MNRVQIIDKIDTNKELLFNEIEYLYHHFPLSNLMFLAHQKRLQIHQNNKVSWQIDRNVNIGNECISGCKFCAFHTTYKSSDAFNTSMEEYATKIEEMFRLGGSQILLQGGLHPKNGLQFYIDLFSSLKSKYPNLKLHALGPPEIAHIARLEKLDYITVLKKLVEAGLDSLPGAGAEILVDSVRKKLSPGKPNTQAWLDVMENAHQLNLTTSATMVFGHIETLQERIEHLLKIRDLQKKSLEKYGTGFMAFILWPMRLNQEQLQLSIFRGVQFPSLMECLRMIALSRIVLYNIPNIQTSWLSMGISAAQLSLYGGANDMGSIMIEENVISKVNSEETTVTTAKTLKQAIIEAGFEPWLRNQKYQNVEKSNHRINN